MIKKIAPRKLYIFFIFLQISVISKVFSEEKIAAKDPKKFWHVSLGFGVALKNNIRKDNTYSGSGGDLLTSQIPLIQIALGPISIGAQGFTANLLGNREIAGYLNINRAGDRYYSVGMESRKESWFFGAGIKYHKFNFLISRDINGRSHGLKTSVSYSAMYPIGPKLFTRSSAGIECYNKSFAEYYFGVRSTESNSFRSEYHPNGYCLPTLSFFPGYKYSEDLSVLLGTAIKGLASAIYNSPTTDGSRLEMSLILGTSWKF